MHFSFERDLNKMHDVWQQKNNNFDLLRLVFAYGVIVSHSYALFAGQDQIGAYLNELIGLGGLCVQAFFVISGMLIIRSAFMSKSAQSFIVSRVIRLYPAAFICAIFCALVIGTSVTTLSYLDYLLSDRVWNYISRNTLLFSIQYDLPGVFGGNVYQHAVNGSLWSMEVEVRMYIAFGSFIGICRFFGVSRDKISYGLLFICFILLFGTVANIEIIKEIVEEKYNYLSLGYYFSMGGILFINEKRIPKSTIVAMLCLILYVAGLNFGFSEWAKRISLPYLVFYLAFVRIPYTNHLKDLPDISYGIYIYGFPIQQALSYAFYETVDFGCLMLLSLGVSTVLAVASRRFIEIPALNSKERLNSFIKKVRVKIASAATRYMKNSS